MPPFYEHQTHRQFQTRARRFRHSLDVMVHRKPGVVSGVPQLHILNAIAPTLSSQDLQTTFYESCDIARNHHLRCTDRKFKRTRGTIWRYVCQGSNQPALSTLLVVPYQLNLTRIGEFLPIAVMYRRPPISWYLSFSSLPCSEKHLAQSSRDDSVQPDLPSRHRRARLGPSFHSSPASPGP